MTPIESPQTLHMWLAGITLLSAYLVIFSEICHRSNVTVIGAVVMVGVGSSFGFYSQEAAMHALDGNTLLLLAGMMMVVVMLRPTGGFEYLAIRIAKLSGGDPRLLLIYLTLAVSMISMILDNVTTVLIFAPLTVLITRILTINPMPYLMAEAMLSNIGGAATLVGDPPNLMIGSAGNISFNNFFLHMGPMVLVIWIVTTLMLLFLFRKQLTTEKPIALLDLDESRAITDPSRLKRGLFALAVIVTLFFFHHHLHLYPSFVAFIGVAVAMLLIRPTPEPLFGKVEWSVLIFFAGLFIMVGGVEASGLLALIGHKLAEVAQEPGHLLITCLLLMWVSALISAMIDNIPFTVAMIPIIAGLEAGGVNITPLWWALAIGVGLGGNGSHIGATANIICITESERCGDPSARITPAIWLKTGLPTMFTGLLIATAAYTLFFDFFAAI